MTKRILLHVILPLMVGTFVYLLFRSRDLPITSWSASFSHPLQTPHNQVARLAIGTLPDFSWAWAFGSAIALVWGNRPLRESLPWLIGGGVVAATTEVAQAFGLIPGTFDVLDLLAIAIGYALGAYVVFRSRNRIY